MSRAGVKSVSPLVNNLAAGAVGGVRSLTGGRRRTSHERVVIFAAVEAAQRDSAGVGRCIGATGGFLAAVDPLVSGAVGFRDFGVRGRGRCG
jgi:hypothetical protein